MKFSRSRRSPLLAACLAAALPLSSLAANEPVPNAQPDSQPNSQWGLGLAVGLAVTLPHSAGYLNPAVTLMLWVYKRLEGRPTALLFTRQELDRTYRRFTTLADEIKAVEDHHILAIIEEMAEANPA